MAILPGRLAALVFVTLSALAAPLSAEEWPRSRIERLPDSAFAVVEVAPDGRKVRHLPHHDEEGEVDLPHLKAALSRIGQVHWLHPESEAIARRHLEDHRREFMSRP